MLVSQLWICLEVPGSDSYPRDLSCAPNSARSFVMRRTTSAGYPAIPTNFSAVTVIAEQGVLRERFSWRNAQRLGAGGGIRTSRSSRAWLREHRMIVIQALLIIRGIVV